MCKKKQELSVAEVEALLESLKDREGEPVEIRVNGKVIGRVVPTLVSGELGVRIITSK